MSVLITTSLYLWNPAPLQMLRYATFDEFQRWQPRSYKSVPVHIIDIDETSLQRIGQWPWSRTRIAELVNRLNQAQAAVIAFDVIFSEPDRNSPQILLRDHELSSAVLSELAKLPDNDAVLEHSISEGNVVLGFALDQHNGLPDLLMNKAKYIFLGEPPEPYLHKFEHALVSIPGLQSAAHGNGAITFIPDADGIVRKVPLIVRQGDSVLPSLAAEALRVYVGASNYIVQSLPNPGEGIAKLRIGKLEIPTTPQGETWIHYTKPLSSRYIPAWQILSGHVPVELLKNNILLVGTSAHGLMDLRFSPVSGVIPGVEVHAQMLEQVLSGDSINRPSWSKALEVLVILLLGLALGIFTLRTGGIISLVCLLVISGILMGGAWRAYSSHGLLLDPLLPCLALTFTFLAASISRHVAIDNHQRWVKMAFSRYISPNLLNYLIEHPETLVLGARRTNCSFIFTDLAGFTQLMETLAPEDASKRLNNYLEGMVRIAFLHHGTLDRIVGDSVAIMFSAPVHQFDHQLRAMACAVDMHKFSQNYLAELNVQGLKFCPTRIGVHSGEVVVGNFGGTAIFDYRALGDAVNTASRLEQANKRLGTLICVSDATLAGCPDWPTRPIGRILLRGKSNALMIHEPVVEVSESDDAYSLAFKKMHEQHPDALQLFESLSAKYPQHVLIQLHVHRLRRGDHSDVIDMERPT